MSPTLNIGWDIWDGTDYLANVTSLSNLENGGYWKDYTLGPSTNRHADGTPMLWYE